jgi:hypothetical protein
VPTDVPRESLRTLFVTLSGLSASRVLWAGESKGFAGKHVTTGKSGHLILDVIATRRLGHDEEERAYNVEVSAGVFRTRVTYSGYRVRTIQVKAENYDAEEGYDLLEKIRMSLGSDETAETLLASQMAVVEDIDVRAIPGSADNRVTSFAVLDVRFSHRVSLVVDKDPTATGDTYIDQVEATGQDDLARITTFTVGPVP